MSNVQTIQQSTQAAPVVSKFDAALANAAAAKIEANKPKVVQLPAGTMPAAAPIPTQDTKPAPKSDKVALRKADRLAKDQQTIGDCMASAGEVLGSFQTLEHDLRISAEQNVQDYLSKAKKLGLTLDMLKSGQPCYVMLVETWDSVRVANGLQPLSDGTRYNYLSRIRRYVEGTDSTLDLFGNKAVAKAKKDGTHGTKKGAQAPRTAATPQPVADKIDAGKQAAQQQVDALAREKSLRGAQALSLFLAEWLEANNGNQALEAVRKMAGDLLQHVNLLTGAKK